MDELHFVTMPNETNSLANVTDFAHSLNASNETAITERLPDFPVENLKLIAQIVEANPSAMPYELIHRLYPFDVFLPKDVHKNLQALFESLKIQVPDSNGGTMWRWKKTEASKQKISQIERAPKSHIVDGKSSGEQISHHIGMVYYAQQVRDHSSINMVCPISFGI